MTRFLPLLSLLVLAACDSAGPEVETPDTVAVWAGSYTGQSRYGSTSGTWGNGGTFPLVVSASGQVTVSGGLITGTYDAATSTYTWTRADGNATNGTVTFRETYTSDKYFRDLANSTAGQSFTGSIQRAGEGPLDYRGVLR